MMEQAGSRYRPRAAAMAVLMAAVLALGVCSCTNGSAGGQRGGSASLPAASTPTSPSGSASAGSTSAGGTVLADPAVMPVLRSGLSWRSGVYRPGSSRARAQAFATWRGRPLDVVVDWPARATWDDVIKPEWLYKLWRGTSYTKVFGVAMLPEEDDSATMAKCAAGDYDARWRQFGRIIKARGLDEQTIVRLGWEFNGDWYKWSAWDPAAFVACWRHIVASARTQAPRLRWDWTVNRGEGKSVTDARKAYPGDAYVDIVGVDAYDAWPGATTEMTWLVQYAGPYGLKFWADFAAAHRKPLSVPEWGVYPGTAFRGHSGGDNALYIRKMVEFFQANAASLAYEAYFNEPAAYYAGSLYDPVQNPRASAAYLEAYRP